MTLVGITNETEKKQKKKQKKKERRNKEWEKDKKGRNNGPFARERIPMAL